MIDEERWKIDMYGGVYKAFLFGTINQMEKALLCESIRQPINERRMNEDTRRRLNRKGKK